MAWALARKIKNSLHLSEAAARRTSPAMNSTLRIFNNAALLVVGSIVYIVGLKGVLIPHQFLNGGIMGIVIILTHLMPVFNFGLLYFLINIPLFVLGWHTVSHRFIYYTGFGILAFSLLVDIIEIAPISVSDPMLSALVAGIICGLGGGLILRSSGSAGGLDILAVQLFKKYSLPMGWTGFMVNAVILLTGLFIYNLEAVLYTLIFLFTQAKVIDSVVTGFNRRKAIMVISDRHQEIAEAIMQGLSRGVTFLNGTGAYTGNEKRVVYSVIMLTELARVKALVFSIDPDAFVVVNDTLDVLGKGLGRMKEY